MVEAAASRRLCASKAPILGGAEPAFQLMRPSSPTREGKHLMKSYKLIGWPDLPAPLMRTPYQRMLHQMSHQFVTISALAACSGLSRPAVMQFLEYLLGVGMLHLLPHAFLEFDKRIDTTMLWVVTGFFLMFLLERAFHGHSHHTADGGESGEPSSCGHDHCHDHDHRHDHPHSIPTSAAAGRWAWCGAFAGLALHSLADGAALAASVQADGEHGVGWLAGFATFLAVLLHKQ